MQARSLETEELEEGGGWYDFGRQGQDILVWLSVVGGATALLSRIVKVGHYEKNLRSSKDEMKERFHFSSFQGD